MAVILYQKWQPSCIKNGSHLVSKMAAILYQKWQPSCIKNGSHLVGLYTYGQILSSYS
jgi:hypothetical protein